MRDITLHNIHCSMHQHAFFSLWSKWTKTYIIKISYNLFVYYRLHIALYIIRFKKGAHAYTVQEMKQMKNKITMKKNLSDAMCNEKQKEKSTHSIILSWVWKWWNVACVDSFSIWIFPVAWFLFSCFCLLFFVPTSHFMLLLICTSFKLNDRLRLIFFFLFFSWISIDWVAIRLKCDNYYWTGFWCAQQTAYLSAIEETKQQMYM